MAEVIDSGWLTQGPKVEAFERAFAKRHSIAHAGAAYKGWPTRSRRYGRVIIPPAQGYISTGEGGMVETNDPALADKARMLRNHGASVSEEVRETRMVDCHISALTTHFKNDHYVIKNLGHGG